MYFEVLSCVLKTGIISTILDSLEIYLFTSTYLLIYFFPLQTNYSNNLQKMGSIEDVFF